MRFVGSTWRVGGLLALSRAFGDAYLKPTGDFEGFGSINADYSSGFGVEATPFIVTQEITPEDKYLVLSSDGLYANEERGGGGGLQLEDVATMVRHTRGGRGLGGLAGGGRIHAAGEMLHRLQARGMLRCPLTTLGVSSRSSLPAARVRPGRPLGRGQDDG